MIWIPAGFRANCYSYRKGHERLCFLDPVVCMVVESRRHYAEETAFPFAVLRCSFSPLKGV